MKSILEGKTRVENQAKTDMSLCPLTSTKNAGKEIPLRIVSAIHHTSFLTVSFLDEARLPTHVSLAAFIMSRLFRVSHWLQ
jgi:hypothetical protein